MKNSFLSALFFVLLQASTFAQSQLSVMENPSWKAAAPEDIASLASQPNVEVIDFSMQSERSGAFMIKTPAGMKVNREFIEGTVTGYTKGIERKGFHMVDHKDVQVGPLSAVLLRAEQGTGGEKSVILTYMMYADHDLYSLSFFGKPDPSPESPMVMDYLSRIKFSPDLVPADMNSNPAYELGRKIGFVAGAIVGVFIVLGIVLFIVLKPKKTAL